MDKIKLNTIDEAVEQLRRGEFVIVLGGNKVEKLEN